MKKILTALVLFAASCSVTEASSWITTLLSLKNANYVADSAGTITMDGYTFTLHETRSATTAIYQVHIGEFAQKEAESIGFCRFDIIDAALNDSRITEPLIRYDLRDTSLEAYSAPKLTAGQVLAVPQKVTDERFLRTVRNITHRALQANGADIATIRDPNANFFYMPGLVAADGLNIYFEDVKTLKNGGNDIPPSYYRDSQWKFVSAPNFKGGVYQKVTLARKDPNEGFPPDTFYDSDPARPLLTEMGTENKFIGVQHKSDGLYFFYPDAIPDNHFKNAADVVFTGHSVKVSRPLNAGDVI